MFKNAHQTGFLSILYSVGANPLQIWDQKVKNGHIRRVSDEDIKSLALEISGTNVATTYIICPADPKQTLGIRLPFFVMIVKNMKKYFTFEIQIMDDKNQNRRFRVSNYQSTTRVRPFCTTMPIGLSSGWNQIQFNLADFTRRAYGSTYLETVRVQIHANVRIRRIYFSDRLYSEDEMPKEYKLYLPVGAAAKRGSKAGKPDEKALVDQGTDPKSKTAVQDQEVIPSGAPPTPTGSVHEEKAAEEPAAEAPAEEPAEGPSEAPSEAAAPEAAAASVPPSKHGSQETIPPGSIAESARSEAGGEATSEAPAPTETEATELAEATGEATTEPPPEETTADITSEAVEKTGDESSEAPPAPMTVSFTEPITEDSGAPEESPAEE